jgi:hypothetical protein
MIHPIKGFWWSKEATKTLLFLSLNLPVFRSKSVFSCLTRSSSSATDIGIIGVPMPFKPPTVISLSNQSLRWCSNSLSLSWISFSVVSSNRVDALVISASWEKASRNGSLCSQIRSTYTLRRVIKCNVMLTLHVTALLNFVARQWPSFTYGSFSRWLIAFQLALSSTLFWGQIRFLNNVDHFVFNEHVYSSPRTEQVEKKQRNKHTTTVQKNSKHQCINNIKIKVS